jgi:hypothetical protein
MPCRLGNNIRITHKPREIDPAGDYQQQRPNAEGELNQDAAARS